MLWEFKNNKNTTETVKKSCNFYGQGVITDYKVQNWFLKFLSSNKSLRDGHRLECPSDLDQDALRELVECNPYKKYMGISTWLQHILIHTR